MTNEEAVEILIKMLQGYTSFSQRLALHKAIRALKEPKSLTFDEKCIFIASMERERQICEKLDKESPDSPSKQSLVFICKEIERKVKATLWGV